MNTNIIKKIEINIYFKLKKLKKPKFYKQKFAILLANFKSYDKIRKKQTVKNKMRK